MPRIYTSDNDPIDFCRRCMPTEANAARRYGNRGDGPDGRGNCYGYDAEHPNYDDDPTIYRCRRCHKVLDGTIDA